jgi:hypothetical protein
MKRVVLALMLILTLASPALAATRFFFNSTVASDISPAYDSTWRKEASGVGRREMNTAGLLDSSAMTSFSGTPRRTSGASTVFYQGVSNPISNTITAATWGTASWAFRGSESSTSSNSNATICISVWSGDGATRRGRMLTPTAAMTSTELTTTLSSKYKSGMSLSTLQASKGDRIVVELGTRQNAAGGDYTVNINVGQNSRNLVPRANNDTNAWLGWVEFSNNFRVDGERPQRMIR